MTKLSAVRQRAESDARTNGYYLNPNPEFLDNLIEGLKTNEERYTYPACPCRLSSGIFDYDRDIICPCDYRDADVEQFGACYCGLYVRRDVYEGNTEFEPVPERRLPEKQARAYETTASPSTSKKEHRTITTVGKNTKNSMPEKRLWYCKQCGYVAFRDSPPFLCPICKAKKELFEEIRTCVKPIS